MSLKYAQEIRRERDRKAPALPHQAVSTTKHSDLHSFSDSWMYKKLIRYLE